MLALVTKNNDKNHYHRKSKGFYVKINYIDYDGNIFKIKCLAKSVTKYEDNKFREITRTLSNQKHKKEMRNS
ncbi:hypothetical protein Ae201684_019036 [Aphanomyces euteiches]|uniref:Uncharacterized protein n=1 Tax=Aphanomyces euteiches TaxID=100861 RepID=A0A6G0W3P8_9STRA|nr:hypothetical protein Ae201684_019036 [Aphanomyces euteiches]